MIDNDIYTIEKWREQCVQGNFIDYDGFGYLGTEMQESKIRIYPSESGMTRQYPEYTHVWWYNR